jgi:hypothetical protein
MSAHTPVYQQPALPNKHKASAPLSEKSTSFKLTSELKRDHHSLKAGHFLCSRFQTNCRINNSTSNTDVSTSNASSSINNKLTTSSKNRARHLTAHSIRLL